MTIRTLLAASALAFSIPASPLWAEADAGAYLAARQANMGKDFAAGALYLTQSLLADPTNPNLLENALIAYVGLGSIEQAAVIANQMIDGGIDSQLANLVRNIHFAHTDNWDQMLADLESGREIGPLVDTLSQAWAQVGKGQISDATTAFDTVIAEAGLRNYGQLHKAYALAAVGDFEGAHDLFQTGPGGGLRYTGRSAVAHAQILSQLGETDSALAVIDGVFGENQNPLLLDLRAKLTNKQAIPFSFANTAQAGMAETYLAVARAIDGEAQDEITLLYTRAAAYLDPENTDAILMSGTLLERLEQYDLANDTYRSVPDDSFAFQQAELGRSAALRLAGKTDAAIEVLQTLQKDYVDFARGHATLGDTLRSAERYQEAIDAYSTALDLYPDGDPAKWIVYYTRGISYHQTDNWPKAEADFRAALDLNPDQPAVLNYLGYSMVERNINLEEALEMIERAVAAQPQNGAIVDSLGWVLFQFGKYEEAVGHLETAASLLAVDPIINDHLGDAYWAVGREIEAYFQWNRAMSFEPTEKDAARIRRKLDVGLDAVLIEEGAEPLRSSNGND